MKNFPRVKNKGMALVIMLGMIVLVTVVAVSAILIAGYEARFSNSRLDTQRARMLGDFALGEVIEKLNSIPLDTHWAAAPGRIRYWNGSNWQPINLYSEGQSDSVELNISLTDGSYSIIGPNTEFPTAPSMPVKWMYVLSNGTVTDTLPASGVVGRYAYWVDVENARVNLNTAGLGMTSLTFNPAKSYYEMLDQNPWARDTVAFSTDANGTTKPVFSSMNTATARANTPQYLTGHPSSVNPGFLDGVTEQEGLNTFRFAGSYFLRVDARHARLDSAGNVIGVAGVPDAESDTTVRFFNQPEDWQTIVSKDTFQKNKGYLTVKGRTPELNPWGLPKMVLSTTTYDGADTNLFNEQAIIQRRRWIPPNDPSSEDSRPVQVPMFPSTATTVRAAKDYRVSFRDLGQMSPAPPNNAAGVTEDSLRELFRSLTTTLNTAPPGFSPWSGAYPAGDVEQTAMGIAIRTDSSGSVHTGGTFSLISYNPYQQGNGPTDKTAWTAQLQGEYGPIFPSGKRRWAADTELLLNEITMQAQVVPASARLVVTTAADAASPSLGIPYLLPANPQVVFFSSKPNTPWPANSNLVSLVPDIELMTAKNQTACAGYFSWRKDTRRTPWRATIYDVRVSASGSGGESISGIFDQTAQAGGTVLSKNGLQIASFSITSAALATLDTRDASGNAYALMSRVATGGNAPEILIGPFAPTSSVTVTVSTRVSYTRIYPAGAAVNSRTAMSVPGIIDPSLPPEDQVLKWTFTLPPGGVIQRQSFEISDPRLGPNKNSWVGPGLESIGENAAYTASAGDKSDLSAPDGRFLFVRSAKKGQPSASEPTSSNPTAQKIGVDRQTASRILGLPGVGYLSGVSTGVDSGTPWQTLKFQPSPLGGSAPDWMLWSYFYVPFDRSIENNTDGKMNINAELIPFGIYRIKPLKALLGNRVSGAATLASNIANRTGSGALGSANDMFIYPGQICQVTGVADSGSDEYSKEALVRDLADLVTTQASDFRVFFVVQALKQLPSGTVKVMGEERSEVTLSRSPDTGVRGYSFSYAADPNAFPFWMMTRANYQSTGLDAPKFNAMTSGSILGTGGRSWLGGDRLPNTSDDWMVPQKIEISSSKKIE